MILKAQYDQARLLVETLKIGDLIMVGSTIFAVVSLDTQDEAGNRSCVLLTPKQTLYKFSLVLTDIVLQVVKLLPRR